MAEKRRAVMTIANNLVSKRKYPRSIAMKTAWSIVRSINVKIVYE